MMGNKFKNKLCNEMKEDKRFKDYIKAPVSKRNEMFCVALKMIDKPKKEGE